MKKIVLNISDSTFEKLRFEAIEKEKSIPQVIIDRIFEKPFSSDIEKAFDELIEKEFQKISEAN